VKLSPNLGVGKHVVLEETSVSRSICSGIFSASLWDAKEMRALVASRAAIVSAYSTLETGGKFS
jgi:hypothetical protein